MSNRRKKRILAIGGSVIKTARKELWDVVARGEVDMLIHNGGSMFHDFQLATESLSTHSHPLDALLADYSVNKDASNLVWDWIRTGEAPKRSITALASQTMPVLMFTALGADFWQLFSPDWSTLGRKTWFYFQTLTSFMSKGSFHFINMGSTVIHPEVFIKALAVVNQRAGDGGLRDHLHVKRGDVRGTVVDFQDSYRARTRVAKYGDYCIVEHKRFLNFWGWKGLEKAIKEFKIVQSSIIPKQDDKYFERDIFLFRRRE